MSQQNNQQSSGDIYRERFIGYAKIYTGSWPEPDLPQEQPQQGAGAVSGGLKGALKRQVNHNDKSQTQTSKVTGVKP